MSNNQEEIRNIIREELRALIEEGQESPALIKAKEAGFVVTSGVQDILSSTVKGASDIVGSVAGLLDGIAKLF